MCTIICVLCVSILILPNGLSIDIQPIQYSDSSVNTDSPLEFPRKPFSSLTPIITGNDPKSSNLPPQKFPSSSETDPTGPPILSGSNVNIPDIKHTQDAKLALNNENTTSKMLNKSTPENTTDSESSVKNTQKSTPEQYDMLHNKYKGGQDVDEVRKPEKKATEKDEKKGIDKDEKNTTVKDEKKGIDKDEKNTAEKDEKTPTETEVKEVKDDKTPMSPKKDPKSEVIVSPDFDSKGPKLMNETKAKGESMLESTSKIMAVSSSVLSNTKPKHEGIIEPAKTIVSALLSIAVVLCLGFIGFLVWKRITMRRFGRDVLINEDDFDEVSDMHTFDSAQIQIT